MKPMRDERRTPKNPTYGTWIAMRSRCSNPKNPGYPYYGGRGIYFDPRWNRFENFVEDMGMRPPGKTLDRIDNNGPYCKSNCKWSTPKEQATNRRPNPPKKILEIDGVKLSWREWAMKAGIKYSCLSDRIYAGKTGADLIRPTNLNMSRKANSNKEDTYGT